MFTEAFNVGEGIYRMSPVRAFRHVSCSGAGIRRID